MPCTTGITDSDVSNHFEMLLCKACKYLTKDQIKSLKNYGSGIVDGLDWYSDHLLEDLFQCKQMISSEEIGQFEKVCIKDGKGVNRDQLAYMTTEEYLKRFEEIMSEMERIGYKVEFVQGGCNVIKEKD